MEKCITFHFYKGGTGKSTISSDISILLVKKDIKYYSYRYECLCPTLQTYFSQELTYCISNFLFNTTEFQNVIYDITRLNRNFFITKESQKGLRKILFSFLNFSKEEITKRG